MNEGLVRMRERSRLRVCVWLCLVVLGAGDAVAQQETATVTGVVRDSGGAVLADAAVVVTNVATGISVATRTNADGIYTVPSLRPGEDSLAVERRGFTRTSGR